MGYIIGSFGGGNATILNEIAAIKIIIFLSQLFTVGIDVEYADQRNLETRGIYIVLPPSLH